MAPGVSSNRQQGSTRARAALVVGPLHRRRHRRRRWLGPALFLGALGVAATAHAQKIGDALGKESITNRPIFLVLAIAALALVPLLIVMVTSFVKIAVVLAIVRQAIGTQQIPPTMVITGISIVMTVYIMAPVGLDAYHAGQDTVLAHGIRELNLKKIGPNLIADLTTVVQEPLREFLIRHAHTSELDFFTRLAKKMRVGRGAEIVTEEDFAVILPSFVMSELKEAFQIGFILFMPFLVIDMVIANILMALGMQMLSPVTIALPFKILLFVVVDGWHMLAKGLVIGYY